MLLKGEKIRMEKDILTKIQKRYEAVPNHEKLALFATFFITLVANIYVFTNRMINHDDLLGDFVRVDSIEGYAKAGRWMNYFIRLPEIEWGAPLTHGILSIMLLSVSVYYIVKILKIEHKVLVAMLAAILGTFPLNACYFSYMSSAECYYFALFTAVLSVWFVEKGTVFGFLVAIVCNVMCLGIYPTFLGISIGLIVILYYLKSVENDFNFKFWFLCGLRDTIMVVVSFGVYQKVTKFILETRNVTLNSYMGEDQLFVFSFGNVIDSIKLTYQSFRTTYYRTYEMQVIGWDTVNIILTVLLVVWVFTKAVRIIRKENIKFMTIIQIGIVGGLTLMIPVLLDNVYLLMNGRADAHGLMRYCILLPYILIVAVMQRIVVDAKYKIVFKNGMLLLNSICLIWVIYCGFVTTNKLYTRMNANNMAIDTQMTSIMTQLFQTEGYTVDTPLYFANVQSILGDGYTQWECYEELTSGIWTGTDLYPWFNERHFFVYLREYLYINPPEISDEEKEAIRETVEFQNMPYYPNQGSIRKINGVYVIKIGEN